MGKMEKIGKRKMIIVLVVISLLVIAVLVAKRVLDARQESSSTLQLGKEKITKLHFYFHDILSGKNPSAVRVAQARDSDKSPTLFGALVMVDDPLTEGPEPTSKLMGQAQGLYGSADQESLAFIMVMTFSFSEGVYSGSSLSVLGRNPVMNLTREMPIVGGTGIFRLARGIAVAKTYWFNATNGDAIVEYNVTVYHYEQDN